MGTSITSTGVTFPDATTQTTAVINAAKALNIQTFNSSGTWTKPTGYASASRVLIECWGGGGSGCANTTQGVGGGGGGAYNYRWMNLSDLGSTVTVTVAAGGSAVAVNTGGSNAGGTSTFGSHVSAYGGGGGADRKSVV